MSGPADPMVSSMLMRRALTAAALSLLAATAVEAQTDRHHAEGTSGASSGVTSVPPADAGPRGDLSPGKSADTGRHDEREGNKTPIHAPIRVEPGLGGAAVDGTGVGHTSMPAMIGGPATRGNLASVGGAVVRAKH